MNENIKRQHELLEKRDYDNLDAGENYYSKKSKYRRKQKYNSSLK